MFPLPVFKECFASFTLLVVTRLLLRLFAVC